MTYQGEKVRINKQKIARMLVYTSVFMAIMYAFLQLAIALGIEEKAIHIYAWDLIAGGTTGALMGVLFFLVFGGIGWVSGVIYGSIGLVSLMLGGALGGLGLSSIVHVARNPERYEFNWLVLISVLLVGFLISRYLAQLSVKYYINRFEKKQSRIAPEQENY